MKRMADLGTLAMSPELADLRTRIVSTLDKMTDAVWPADIHPARTSTPSC